MMVLTRSERAHAILFHFGHYFWISVAMALIFGGLLFIVSCRRDLWLRYTAAETRFWERLGFPSGRVSHALRRFVEGTAYRYILWCLLIAFVTLMLVNGAMYLYFKHRFDHINI
jgi:hypothetical protein